MSGRLQEQFLEHRCQLGGVWTPAFDAARVDRLSHLILAGGGDQAILFEEPRAGRVIVELEKIEHALQRRIEISDPL